MPKNENRSEQDFSKYDAMSAEQLAEILRSDSEAPAGNELDIDSLLYITGVLAERETGNSSKTAQEAWDSFQENYLPEQDTHTEKMQKNAKPWMRYAAAAAAVVALAVLIPLSTINAMKIKKMWNTEAIWGNGHFAFVPESPTNHFDQNDPCIFETPQQVLPFLNMDPAYYPTWVPERFEYEASSVNYSEYECTFVAEYYNENKTLTVSFRAYNGIPAYHATDPEIIECYTVGGVDYYIFNNYHRLAAFCLRDNTECSITGEITLEELKAIIDSIPKG